MGKCQRKKLLDCITCYLFVYLSQYSQLCCASHAPYSLSPSSGTSYNAALNILAWLWDLSLNVEKHSGWVCPARDPLLGAWALPGGSSIKFKREKFLEKWDFKNSATLMLVVSLHLPSCIHPSCFPPHFFLLFYFSFVSLLHYTSVQGPWSGVVGQRNTDHIFFLWVLLFCFNSFLVLTFVFIHMLWFLLFVFFFFYRARTWVGWIWKEQEGTECDQNETHGKVLIKCT